MATNGVADSQSLTSTEDSGHGLSEDSDHSRLALSTFRPKWNQQPRTRVQPSATSDDTGVYIVETAERRAVADIRGGGAVGPWTMATSYPSYGNNLATGYANSDKLSPYKFWQPTPTPQARSRRGSDTGSTSPSMTQLKRTTPAATAQLGRTSGRSAERSLKKNNEDNVAASKSRAPSTMSSLPPVSPNVRPARTPPSPRSTWTPSQRRAAAVEQNLSPVASSTDANVSDLESSTSGSFLVLGPHGTSRLSSCVSEL